MAIGVTGLLATLAAAWFFFYPNPEPLDLTTNQLEQSAEPSNQISATDTISVEVPETITRKAEPTTAKPKIKDPVKPAVTIPKNVETHITVGRIVDTKGIPVFKATVTYGNARDTTDKSGYYALKVSDRGIKVKVIHLSTPYLVEIDSHQNWEIVLDIAEQKVIDYYPMNAANRFK